MNTFLNTLHKARQKKYLLEFDRRPLTGDRWVGFPLWENDNLIAVHLLSEYTFDAIAISRTADIRRCRRVSRDAHGLHSFLIDRQYPEGTDASLPPELTDCRDWRLLEHVHRVAPLVWIEMEKKKPEVGYLGRVVKVGKKSVRLRLVTSRGEWEDADPMKIRLNDVTCVRLGGLYVNPIWEYMNRMEDNPDDLE